MSSRAIPPAASPACNDLPTSRSFPYRSAQSKCRNPASSASLVAVIVRAASGIKVPKPSAGMWPAPWLSGILVILRAEDSVMVTPPSHCDYAPWVRSRQEQLEADLTNAWNDDPISSTVDEVRGRDMKNQLPVT